MLQFRSFQQLLLRFDNNNESKADARKVALGVRRVEILRMISTACVTVLNEHYRFGRVPDHQFLLLFRVHSLKGVTPLFITFCLSCTRWRVYYMMSIVVITCTYTKKGVVWDQPAAVYDYTFSGEVGGKINTQKFN